MSTVPDLFEESIPMPRTVAPDLTRLAAELCSREYTDLARGGVLAYARDLGTFEGCPWVDPSDRADLDAILEQSWPAVPQTSSAWDESPWKGPEQQPTWTLERRARIAALYEAHGATLTAADDDQGGAPEYEDLVPPEIDLEDFVPSEEDEAYYSAWVAAREAELAAEGVLMPDPEVYPIHF